MKLIRIGLLIAASAVMCVSSVFAEEVTVKKDVVYATHDGVPLYGDLYLPATPGPHPAMMLIHGGAWKVGSKTAYGFSWGPYLAERGFVVFSIDYRLSKPNQPTWPQALLDCKAALQYLRGNAASLAVDPDRIGVGGDSAGGELSSLLALTQDWPAFAKGYPNDEFVAQSTKVKAVVPAYAVYSMANWWMWTKKGFKPEALEYNSLDELFGGTPTQAQAAYFEASPINYVFESSAALKDVALPNQGLRTPWFVTWGEEDPIVPAEGQSLAFVQALKDAGASVVSAPVPNVGHFWFSRSKLTGQTGVPAYCKVEPGNIVVCAAASPNDFIGPRLLEFLAKNLGS
jgi:acetyl esterase/lipase